jgi:(S)-ureidoglycine aminohydrolase
MPLIVRIIIFASVVVASNHGFAQTTAVSSNVYRWDQLKPYKEENRIRQQIVDGSTSTLQQLEIHTSKLEPNEAPHGSHSHADMEELIIVKEGMLRATIKDQTKILSSGSIAYVLPGDEHGFFNGGDTPCTYYILKFKAKTPFDTERGKMAGGSFMMEWKDIAVNKTEKGMRRNLFDRPTALFARFEMHVTTLNKGFSSHDPHTHTPEEIILVRLGQGNMHIAGKEAPVDAGGLSYVDTKVPHAMTNTGDGQVEYYAFQWN